MSSRILDEIEKEAVSGQPDLPTLLRKCIALGGQTGSTDLRDWATKELKGYGSDDELPSYRTVPAILAIDGWTMTHRVTGQQISPANLPEPARELIKEEVALRGPIAELTDLVAERRRAGAVSVDLGIPGGASLAVLVNSDIRAGGDSYRTVERVYRRVAITAIVGVIDTVHTNLVELVAEMRAGLGKGSDLPDKDLADRAVNIVINGDRNRVEVANAVADTGGIASVASAAQESKSRRIMFWVAGGATVIAAIIGLLEWHPWH
ncbi:MAG: hypothetical protein ABSA65_16900 [Acidimicrobiales bacterium]